MLEEYLIYLFNPNGIDATSAILFLIVNICAALYLLFKMNKAFKKSKMLQSTPTSKIRSAAQGYVELFGRIKPQTEVLESPYRKESCLWYHSTLHEYRRHGKSGSWQLIEQFRSDDPFILDDESGFCMIDPDEAEVITQWNRKWYTRRKDPNAKSSQFFSKYKYEERLLPVKADIFAIGMYRTLSQTEKEASKRKSVNELIALWKKDFKSLLQEFDQNQDETLCTSEWKAVIHKAESEIDKSQNNQDDFNILSNKGLPKDYPFIISDPDQHEVISRKNKKAFWSMLGTSFFGIHSVYAVCTLYIF